MISVDYVHASDNEYKIENEYMEHAQELDMMMLEYQVISETADFEAIFEEANNRELLHELLGRA